MGRFLDWESGKTLRLHQELSENQVLFLVSAKEVNIRDVSHGVLGFFGEGMRITLVQKEREATSISFYSRSLDNVCPLSEESLCDEIVFSDPMLSRYSAVVFKNVERTIYFDILIAMLRCISKRRGILFKIIFLSSLISEIWKIYKYYNEEVKSIIWNMDVDISDSVPITFVPINPIVYYMNKMPFDLLSEIQSIIHRICSGEFCEEKSEERGILVYLCSLRDIEKLRLKLKDMNDLAVYEIHSGIGVEKRTNAINANCDNRKLLLSTNSLERTPVGIKYIVDTGLVKVPCFNFDYQTNEILTIWISKIEATKRILRTENTHPTVFRMYTKDTYELMRTESSPELERVCSLESIMKMEYSGISARSFEFVSDPDIRILTHSYKKLYGLGLCNEKLIPSGSDIIFRLNIDPCLSTSILKAHDLGCSEELTILASMITLMTTRNLKILPLRCDYIVEEGDHIGMLNYYYANRNTNTHKIVKIGGTLKRISRILKHGGVWPLKRSGNVEHIIQSLYHGSRNNIAVFQSCSKLSVMALGKDVFVHPYSSLFKKSEGVILFHNIIFTEKPFINICTSISKTSIINLPKTVKIR